MTGPSQARPLRPQIAIVDDHPLFRIGIRSLLEQSGRYVVCAEYADAPSALALLRRSAVDLVLIDITLRGGSGLELLKRLKVEQPQLRALIMSMHEAELYDERARRAGAIGYLKKDTAPALVLAAIARALQARPAPRSWPSAADTPLLAAADSDSVRSLSDRELEVFALLGQGQSTRNCADRLHISVKTVEAHQAAIKIKLGLVGINQLRRHAVLWLHKSDGTAPH
jgi:DNA-binding NarL/FixJ family response regulator